MERRGTVYIGARSRNNPPRFTGYWEAEDYFGRDETPPGLLERGPGWEDPDEAIKWGRDRATVVIVRIGNTHYSAGDELALDEDDQPLPEWPPPVFSANPS
jgi:hypothetical protein